MNAAIASLKAENARLQSAVERANEAKGKTMEQLSSAREELAKQRREHEGAVDAMKDQHEEVAAKLRRTIESMDETSEKRKSQSERDIAEKEEQCRMLRAEIETGKRLEMREQLEAEARQKVGAEFESSLKSSSRSSSNDCGKKPCNGKVPWKRLRQKQRQSLAASWQRCRKCSRRCRRRRRRSSRDGQPQSEISQEKEKCETLRREKDDATKAAEQRTSLAEDNFPVRREETAGAAEGSAGKLGARPDLAEEREAQLATAETVIAEQRKQLALR